MGMDIPENIRCTLSYVLRKELMTYIGMGSAGEGRFRDIMSVC
jgi:hypothetical protein